jgi:hypothetical protein
MNTCSGIAITSSPRLSRHEAAIVAKAAEREHLTKGAFMRRVILRDVERGKRERRD